MKTIKILLGIAIILGFTLNSSADIKTNPPKVFEKQGKEHTYVIEDYELATEFYVYNKNISLREHKLHICFMDHLKM